MRHKKKYLALSLLLIAFNTEAGPLDTLPKNPISKKSSPILGIEAVYCINAGLDPFADMQSLDELKKFQIQPIVLSPIKNHHISQTSLHEIGLKFSSDMQKSRWASYCTSWDPWQKDFVFLTPTHSALSIFSVYISQETILKSLNFLNVIKNAHEMNYAMIWIVDGAIQIVSDPNQIPVKIDSLNKLIGKDQWDILYTDNDTHDYSLYQGFNDFESDLKGLDLSWFWRPDHLPDFKKLSSRTVVSQDFIKIGSRMRTHSLIINKTGLEKIMTYYASHGCFNPLDHEIAMIPNIQLYALRNNLVTLHPSSLKKSGQSQ
jgi:hypothetical protein